MGCQLQRHPSRLDKSPLAATDLALLAYVRVVVEVAAAHKPEQLVDVVGVTPTLRATLATALNTS
jgi:hypothetical protein